MTSATNLIQSMYHDYAGSVGLDSDAKYLHGTPLRPVVPLDQGEGGLFILGAYPSARFAQIDKVTDVPVADNLGPFESERWFDGNRIRVQPSAKELEDLFLTPLEVERTDCWITDLVKVFLFKPGHVDRYTKLKVKPPRGYTRDRFMELGEESLPWLGRELKAARPKLVITLGAEVAGVIQGVRSQSAQVKLLKPEVSTMTIEGVAVEVIHCAHPGILMRRAENNPWPERHVREFLPKIKRAIA